MELKTVKLGDICLKICSGGTPSSKVADYYNPPTIPWLTTSEVNYSCIYTTKKGISENGLNNSSAKLIPINSVIVAMYGQGNTAGRVAINKIPLATNQACCNLIINSELADYRFVYYALSAKYNELVALKNGGAQPNLNAKKIREFEIPFPSRNIQERIGDILSAYDEMIDNCKAQIALLEEAAQRLYREWFVDMRFPGHGTTYICENGLPVGWERHLLSNVANVRYGYAFDGKKFNNIGQGFPILRIRNIPESYTNDYTTESADDQYIVSQGDIVVGMDGEFHINSWADKKAYLVQRTCAIDPIEESNRGYLYMAITAPIKFFEKTLTGATVAHLGKKHLDSIEVILPPKSLREVFTSYYNERLTQMIKIRNLICVRDMLLSRLISGQIEIKA